MGDAVINCFATVLNYKKLMAQRGHRGKAKRLITKRNDDVLCITNYDDASQLEKFSSALLMVLNKDASLMKLTGYRVIVFPILENHHFYLASFDMEKVAISIIDNMHANESYIEFSDDSDFFNKTAPYKVKDVFIKYLKSVHHPKCLEFEPVKPKRLEIEWATIGNSIDNGVFAMRHMETWFGETDLKWDSGFPLAHTQKIGVSNKIKEKVCYQDCLFPCKQAAR
ncbi:putative papain-like cysteine peptidase superfamily [Helianthus anomalus]